MKKMGLFLLLAVLLLAGFRAVSESVAFPAVSQPTASPSRGRSEDSFLILVNRDNPLPEDYAPQLTWLNNGLNRVRADIYEDLSAMLSAGTEEGLRFVVASAYRDREYQQGLLEEDMAILASAGYSRDEAYREATRTTMPPGCSEHETGLALDIVSLDNQRLKKRRKKRRKTSGCAKIAGNTALSCATPGARRRLPASITSRGTSAMWAARQRRRSRAWASRWRNIWRGRPLPQLPVER